jgi:hypothetical protein
MHVDIRLQHAGTEVMDCATCHALESLDLVRLPKGQPVGMMHSYRMCAACHFQQARDWAGGAHGKRISNWDEERVVMNCTECHDPHHPAVAAGWPAMTPRIPRTPAER